MKHVVVVGAGLTGLSAALQLADQGCRVTLVEARGAAGGRTFSFDDRITGDTLDNGQHALMGCYHATLRYLDRIGSTSRLQRLRGLSLEFRHVDGREASLRAGWLPHPLGLVQGILRYRMLNWRSRAALLRVALTLRGITPHALAELDSITAEEWLHSLGQNDDALEYFWTPVVLATLNALPRQASANLLAVVLITIFLSDEESADMLLPDAGLSDVLIEPAITALRVAGAMILTRHPIVGIETTERKVRSVRCANGTELACAAVVSALPPWALARILQSNGMCDELLPVLRRFRPASIVSLHVWLSRDPGIAAMTGALGTTLQWLFDKGRSLDGSWRISCTVSAAEGLEHCSSDELRAIVKKELPPLLSIRPTDILRIVPLHERRATFLPEPGLTALRPHSATEVVGFYLAGDWIATGLPATIESAVLSGERAAAALMSDLGAVR